MSRSKSLTTITDPLLEPFYITCDRHGYTLHEMVSSDGKHRLSKGDAKETAKPVGYLSNFETCLSYIIKQKERLGGEFKSLNEFKDEYLKNMEDTKKYIDQIKGKF